MPTKDELAAAARAAIESNPTAKEATLLAGLTPLVTEPLRVVLREQRQQYDAETAKKAADETSDVTGGGNVATSGWDSAGGDEGSE